MTEHASGGSVLPGPSPAEMLGWAEFYAFTMGWVIQPIHRWTGVYDALGRKLCSCELTGKKWATCNPGKPGKHPWTGWKQSPMETPEQGFATWRKYFDEFGSRNGVAIGVRTGAVSGIFAVDLDVGSMKDGFGSLSAWMAKAGLSWDDMATLSAQTGGDGCHLIYKYPAGVQKIASVASPPSLGNAIDVRGDGGFILVAPSMHHSGQVYRWRDGIALAPGAPREAPGKLLEAVREKKRAANPAFNIGAYTPTLEELKDYADALTRRKSPRSREIGKNMVAALTGQPIGEPGSRHDVYRDVVFMIRKKWPRCNADEILPLLHESLREWFPDEDAFGVAVENVRASLGAEIEEGSEWTQSVSLNEDGKPYATDGNMVLFFENHPAWRGVLGYNLRTNRPVYLKKPPLKLEVDGSTLNPTRERSWISLWLQDKAQMTGRITASDIQSATIAVASRAAFDPLQQQLLGLRGTWDGVPRLETVFQRVASTPNTEWTRLVAPLWFKSVVARILWPGCQCDTMLILEGPQGYRKSSFFRSLLPDLTFFSDSLNRVHLNVESVRLLHSGPAIFEIGELSGLKKQEVEEIKAFLSVLEDDLRPLYEAHKKVKRRCVFVGTTNRDDYLRDETGGRRFWPLKVLKPLDLQIVYAERGQWFAEALARVEAGERWHLDNERENGLASVEQDERYEEDIWHGTIREYLAPENRAKTPETPVTTGTQQMSEMINKKRAGDFVTTMQIAEHALKLEIKNARTAEGIRITRILRKLGWTPARTENERGWRRPDTR
jgi:predicted P-loop ATPase